MSLLFDFFLQECGYGINAVLGAACGAHRYQFPALFTQLLDFFH